MKRHIQTTAVAAAALLPLTSCTTSPDTANVTSGAPVSASSASYRTPSATPKPTAKPAARSNRMAAGDKVEIFVNEDNSFDGVYPVRQQGDVIIPKLGRIPVSGLTASQVEAKIKSSLEVSQLTKATVIADHLPAPAPAQPTPEATAPEDLKIYLTGKVGRPGLHSIPRRGANGVGAYEALLVGGGVDRFGDEGKAHILRLQPDGRRDRIPLDLEGIRGGTAVDIALHEQDIVVVPERVFGF